MRILFASSNEHKKKEIQQLFKDHEIVLPKELGIDFDCEETGETFMDNAILKARTLLGLSKGMGLPVLADDSGLLVDALPGELGVRTARFGSPDGGVTILGAHEKNQLLLSRMKGLPQEKRTARFMCAMVLMKDEWTIYCVQESATGRILTEEIGVNGFGFDPVFYNDDAQSPMGLVPEGHKNDYSHRGKAARKLLTLI